MLQDAENEDGGRVPRPPAEESDFPLVPPAQPVLERARFADRRAAGRALAKALRTLALPAPLVLALPRGGVPVAAEVARALGAPLDLLMVRKIGAPGQPELAVAAIAALGACGSSAAQDMSGPCPQTVVDVGLMATTGADQAFVDRGVARESAELERRRQRYLQGRACVPLDGRTVIVVDDGIATGTTLRAALKALRAASPPRDLQGAGRAGPRAIVLAVPVAPAQVLAALQAEVDAAVCLWTPPLFMAVGAHYRDFRQVSDEEVVAALSGAASPQA
ncbi:MAG: phosphoribosyltransferase family protein [Betaproteobacteria bacterium]